MQGTLDLLVQRTGEQGEGNVLFVQNNFYYDAFFLKAIGKLPVNGPYHYADASSPALNGGCPSGWCFTPNGSRFHVRPSVRPSHLSLRFTQPFGVSYSGATYKYTVLDTNGKRAAAAGKLTVKVFISCLTPLLSGTATSNSLSIPFDPILLHRPGTHKQLHRELLCGFDKTP